MPVGRGVPQVFGRTEKQQNNLINFRAVSGQRERALGGGGYWGCWCLGLLWTQALGKEDEATKARST